MNVKEEITVGSSEISEIWLSFQKLFRTIFHTIIYVFFSELSAGKIQKFGP